MALRVPRPVADVIAAAARAALAPGTAVRWVDPADLHLTIWFIGPLWPAELPAVEERVGAVAAAARPIECRVDGTGSFGQGRGRAAWVGSRRAGEPPGWRRWRRSSPRRMARTRPTSPCAGVRRPATPAISAPRCAARDALAWRATSLELLRSHPGRRPAYETVADLPPGGRRGCLTAAAARC